MEKSDLLIEILSNPDDTSVRLSGDLDLYSVPDVRPKILSAASRYPDGAFTIDFTEVGFIDSAGLALLLSLRKDSSLSGRLGVIVAENSHPERILRLTRLDTFISVTSRPAFVIE